MEPPAGLQGAETPVRGQGAKPPEAECLFVFACPKEAANLLIIDICKSQ